MFEWFEFEIGDLTAAAAFVLFTVAARVMPAGPFWRKLATMLLIITGAAVTFFGPR